MLVIHLVMLVNATAMAAVGHHSGRRHLRAPLPGAELQRPMSMRRVQPAGLRVAHPGYDLLRAQQPVGGLPARRLRPGEGLQARPELGRGGGRGKPGGRPEAELQREAVGLKQPAWGAHTRHRQFGHARRRGVCVCVVFVGHALSTKRAVRGKRERVGGHQCAVAAGAVAGGHSPAPSGLNLSSCSIEHRNTNGRGWPCSGPGDPRRWAASGFRKAACSPQYLALNIFCQWIQLWMYVIPAADLYRWSSTRAGGCGSCRTRRASA